MDANEHTNDHREDKMPQGQEYEKRASWILENLIDCYNKGSDKFETRLCGVSVCNGCYAVALGYSKRRIEELKSDIRSIGITSEVFGVECNGRLSAVHGNTVHVPRISVGVEAMESVFEKYVTETGCTQPHKVSFVWYFDRRRGSVFGCLD